MKHRCEGTTNAGRRCKAWAVPPRRSGKWWCRDHVKQAAAARARAEAPF